VTPEAPDRADEYRIVGGGGIEIFEQLKMSAPAKAALMPMFVLWPASPRRRSAQC
jgi:hypothetical protein